MNNKTTNVRFLAQLGLLAAIEIVMKLIGLGSVPVGPLYMSFLTVPIAVGAMTILSSVMQFSMLPLQGLSQGAQPIISFNYGAKNIDRVKKAFHLLLRSAACYSTLLWLLCMLVPQIFISIFTSDADLASYTIWALRIYMAASLLFAVQLACQQTFIALGNAKTSVFLALLRKVLLLIPLIFILPLFIQDKVFAAFRFKSGIRRVRGRTGGRHDCGGDDGSIVFQGV